MIRARGIASLNADILYGLPHQTQARITESVQKLLSLSPDRVALYGYAHVPWMSRRQQMIPSDAIPTPEERLHLFETARRAVHLGWLCRDRHRPFRAPRGRAGPRAGQRPPAAQLPGLYRRHRARPDRPRCLVDLALPAGLCAERERHVRPHQGDPRRAVLDPSRPRLCGRGPAARPDHRGADVRFPREPGRVAARLRHDACADRGACSRRRATTFGPFLRSRPRAPRSRPRAAR